MLFAPFGDGFKEIITLHQSNSEGFKKPLPQEKPFYKKPTEN